MPILDQTALSRPRPADFVPGYRLEKLVGKGGMGEVHKATQLSLGRTVAVKLLATELAKDESFVSRFQKEAAALAALSHPNVVAIVDKGHCESTYYLVMEFVDGPSLREQMRSPLFDAHSAIRVMLEICRAIDYAHSRGVIHRDLKPENILLDEQSGGHAKVSDFGLASFMDDASARFNLTQTHVSMGTLSYMAPEQRLDAKTADGRADIFSLGVILYELLIGEVPLGTFDPPSQKKPGLDPRLDPIIQRCLKPDPDDRYQKMAELIADLSPLVQGATQPPVRRSVSVGARVASGARTVVRTLFSALLLVLFLSILTILGASHLERRLPPPRPFTGADLVEELPNMVSVTAQGKLQRKEKGVAFELGEGPASLSFLSAGREVTVQGGVIEFLGATEGDVGRLRVDMTDMGGEGVRLIAKQSAIAPKPSRLRDLETTLFGPLPQPESSLLLAGSAGRYAALTRRGTESVLSLEWALGERSGKLVFPIPEADIELMLELSVDPDGVLKTYVGEGKLRRAVGEPLMLGANWAKSFGEEPRAALACRGETCRFSDLRYEAVRVPDPSVVSAASPPEPRPAPKVVAPVRKPAPKKGIDKRTRKRGR